MTVTASYQSALTITGDGINRPYNSVQTRETLVSGIGPSPGRVIVTPGGTDVDLSSIASPGYAVLYNYDEVDFFEYGIWDGFAFFPLGEVGPGERYILKLSRNIGLSFDTGTGTTGSNFSLRLKTESNTIDGSVEVYER